ncbi:hypothetical protein CEXT_238211 [Caerostris extrusa]|uniref:Uncharacterized protein n=1 Tax=Caerostris extrusa TaxID=172846 RepID=A0AAV4MYR4_CAEEX|nr:hypothetical protein CEXT_238211 [Caerostris extrusa]
MTAFLFPLPFLYGRSFGNDNLKGVYRRIPFSPNSSSICHDEKCRRCLVLAVNYRKKIAEMFRVFVSVVSDRWRPELFAVHFGKENITGSVLR